ncbi:unnamed protein product, partial [Discosporangium mesarthrocarpum]
WRLGTRVGAGACSEVYEAECDGDLLGSFVAKVSPLPEKRGTETKKRKRSEEELNADVLHGEYSLYSGFLRGHPNIPSMPESCYGDDKGLRFLILERLGNDLGSLVGSNGSLPVARVRDLGGQMLTALRILHEKH